MTLRRNGHYANTLTPACQYQVARKGIHMEAFAVDDAGTIALLVTQRPPIGNIASNVVFVHAYMKGCLFLRRYHACRLIGVSV